MQRQTTDNRILTIDDLINILNEEKLNTDNVFSQFSQTRRPDRKKKTLTKNALVAAMSNDKRTQDILENIAYGILTQNQSAVDSWTQLKAGTNHKDIYDARILAGNGRKRNKKTQNKAHVNLSEISKILQKYR